MLNSRHICIILFYLFSFKMSFSQDPTEPFGNILSPSDKAYSFINRKSFKAEKALSRKSEKYIKNFLKQERKLQKLLFEKNPILAASLFTNIESQYNALKSKTATINRYSAVYSGHLDSLTTTFYFLKSNKLAGLSSSGKLDQALASSKELQNTLNYTEVVRKYSQNRLLILKEQFDKLGMQKQCQKYSKQVLYYKAQVEEYKSLFEEPSRLEAKMLQVAQQIPQFKGFFARNSQLGSLFALASSGSNNSSVANQKAGLQTKDGLEQMLKERFGSNVSAAELIEQNIQGAHSGQPEVSLLKNKLSALKSGSYGNTKTDDETMPDYRLNQQKTRSFLKRLEVGTNLQSQKARGIFPVTSDMGLSLGYKLNDKSMIGIGAAYKIGWGAGWNKIRVTHQGVGLRSFADYKIKAGFYVSGGYEQNLKSQIRSYDQLRSYNSWQSSGLIGLTKKYEVSKKLNGNMQLLWDFLSYRQTPKPQPILFRIGYNIK